MTGATPSRFADIRDRDLGRDPWWWRNLGYFIWLPIMFGTVAFWVWVAAWAINAVPAAVSWLAGIVSWLAGIIDCYNCGGLQ